MSYNLAPADIWQILLSSACAGAKVRGTKPGKDSATDIVQVAERLSEEIECNLDLYSRKISHRDGNYFRYEFSETAFWSLLRSTVNAKTYQSDTASLKALAMFMLEEDYSGLLDQIMKLLGLDVQFTGTQVGDTEIVYSRRILWVKGSGIDQEITLMPGLTYAYKPQKKLTAIHVSFSCRALWNWLLGVKYTDLNDLLNIAALKQLDVVIQSLKKEEESSASNALTALRLELIGNVPRYVN